MNDGATAEAEFVRDAVALGYSVSIPIFRTAHFDAIVNRGTKCVRVQVKSCARRHAKKKTHVPAYHVELRRTTSSAGNTKQGYPPGAFDILAIRLVEDRAWLFLPKRRVGSRTRVTVVPHRGIAKRLNNWESLGV